MTSGHVHAEHDMDMDIDMDWVGCMCMSMCVVVELDEAQCAMKFGTDAMPDAPAWGAERTGTSALAEVTTSRTWSLLYCKTVCALHLWAIRGAGARLCDSVSVTTC